VTEARIAVRATAKGVEFGLKVVPRAKKPGVDGLFDGRVKLRLASPPVDGKANKEVVELVARVLKVRNDQVELVAGETSRQKTVRVVGLPVDEVTRRLVASLEDAD
jgi:uncharacterized protein (TIGR00251 family)